MKLEVIAPQPHELNVFDEARLQLDEWQRQHPHAEHIAMVLESADELTITIAGPELKPSAAAGILTAGAHVILE